MGAPAANSPADLPVTGDWVAVTQTDPALIIAVVERQSLFTRVTDDGQTQPLAANIDVAFLVCGLDHDWNPRRLDRYLVLAQEARVMPVAVLNKRDICPDPKEALRLAETVAKAVLISAHHDDLAEKLGGFLGPGQTAALTGQHTTTTRTLIQLPQGWLLLDMPGLRAVGVTGDTAAVRDAFADIVALAANCRFANCAHSTEPGCAVLEAVNPERLAHYQKLLREAAYQNERENPAAARAKKERWKKIHAAMKKHPNKRD